MKEKQKLIANYYGVVCGIIESLDGLYTIDMISSVDRLQLTHPNNITDEHCVELFDLIEDDVDGYHKSDKIRIIKDNIENDYSMSMEVAETIISFLRSKGYAFQCNGRSIEEQVESGDVELI